MSSQQAVQQADALQYGVALLQSGEEGACGHATCQYKLLHLPPELRKLQQ